MANAVNFTTGSIDFESIASALRSYMQYQTEFTDYQFTGSALSTLINLLAYNTHYNSVYDNFALNEAFLDTAFKRESVISHANLLNYLPRSAQASTAIVKLTVTDNNFNSSVTDIALPKFSLFHSRVDGTNYTFYTDGNYVLHREEGSTTFTCDNVSIKQGTYITMQRTYSGDAVQKFVLDNKNVDLSTLTVQVQHDQQLITFNKAENIVDITSDSKVYFIGTDGRGYYQIEFGSGMLGYSLSAGDIVYITYLSCGDEPAKCNGASVFRYSRNLMSIGFSSNAVMTVTTTSRATGGAEPESTESIRLLAPKVFATQDRCITVNDYRSIIMANFANIKALNVWGGQDMDPPQYGKVFLCVIPKEGLTLTQNERNNIHSILKNKKEMTKLVEFVEPDYLYIIVNSTVHFNGRLTTQTASDIETIVRNTITNYGDQTLTNFGSILRYSKLVDAIDNADSSISNNSTKIRLVIKVEPALEVNYSYTIDVSNKIHKSNYYSECVKSTGFVCTDKPHNICYIDDNPENGKLRLFYYDNEDHKVFVRYCGTVDYQTGRIKIDDLNILSIDKGDWTFTINPESNDVISNLNQFALVDTQSLVVNVVDDSIMDRYEQTSIK